MSMDIETEKSISRWVTDRTHPLPFTYPKPGPGNQSSAQVLTCHRSPAKLNAAQYSRMQQVRWRPGEREAWERESRSIRCRPSAAVQRAQEKLGWIVCGTMWSPTRSSSSQATSRYRSGRLALFAANIDRWPVAEGSGRWSCADGRKRVPVSAAP